MMDSSVREMRKEDAASVREKAATTTVETETEPDAASVREDRREIVVRADSVETEITMAREDRQDRGIPRTEDHARVTEPDAASVRAKAVTIEMETEMAADLVRADHREMAVRDVSEEKTVTTVAKDASEDRTIRDSVPVVQEETAAAVPMQCSHQS